MMVFAGYLLLLTITVAYAWCARVLYRRTRSVGLPIGLALVYYWTFAGAWFFIGDQAIGFQGYRIGLGYYYLMEKMFPFVLNGNYLLALCAYSLFAAGLFAALFLLVPKVQDRSIAQVALDHRYILLGGTLCLLFSVLSAVPLIQEAWQTGRPYYLVMHEDTGRMATLRAWADRGASLCYVFGYAILLGSGHPRSYFDDRPTPWQRRAYPFAIVLMGIYLSLLGDRHTLFTVLILAVVYLFDRLRREGLKRAARLVLLLLVMLAFGGWIRGFTPQGTRAPLDRTPFSLKAIAHVPRQQDGLFRKTGNVVLGNEMFCAHFSMFGVLERGVRPETGISFTYLATLTSPLIRTGVPPTGVYDLYAREARLTPGQGYTINHATGWYLNFGWIGLVLGGLFMGGAWGAMLRTSARVDEHYPARLAAIMLPYFFVAYIPPVIRSGPEAYWGMFMEGLVMPMTILALSASLRWPWKSPVT